MARSITPGFTKPAIVQAAFAVAQRHGFLNMTQALVAEHAGCGYGLITLRCGTMTALKRDVMRHAVAAKCLPVIASGLAIKHPAALKAPKELRDQAALTLSA